MIPPQPVGSDDAFKQSLATIRESFLGFLLISLLLSACALLVRVDAILDFHSREVSLTELSQKILLLMTAGRLFYIARVDPSLKQAGIIMGMFFVACFIRELDHWLDRIVHGFWFYPALGVTFLGIALSINPFKELVNQLAAILNTHAGYLLIMSLATLFAFSRVWGMGDFWKEVMGVDYIRVVKNTSEEGIELLGYCMIMYSVYKLRFNRQK